MLLYGKSLTNHFQKELQADANRQVRVKALAAQIQARDDEVRQRQLAFPTPSASLSAPNAMHTPNLTSMPDQGEGPTAISSDSDHSPTEKTNDEATESNPADLRTESQRRTRAEEPAQLRRGLKTDDGPQGWNPTTMRGTRR